MARCNFPILIKNPNFGYGKESRLALVPCGKCANCLKRRRKEWIFRLENEVLDSRHTLFLTLSYDESHNDNELHKEHLLLFIKRLRYHYGKIRYYAIGEYGPKTLRPHYHALVFFKQDNEIFNQRFSEVIRDIRDEWKNGNVVVSSVTPRRITYILHYHVRPKKIDGRDNPCFALSSKRLGMSFLNEMEIERLRRSPNNYVYDSNGKRYTLPRYYRKSLDLPPKEESYPISKESILQYCYRTHTDPIKYKQDLIYLDELERKKYSQQEGF